MASRAHLFLSSKQKCADQIKEYCVCKENCRRQIMLRALGAIESHPQNFPCCDNCDSPKCPQSLRFEYQVAGTTYRQKRRTAVKDVDDDCKAMLKSALLKAVDAYISEHASFLMLGRSFVCPDCVINKIRSEAHLFKSIDDFNIVGIRPELKTILYDVVCNVLSTAPVPKRRRI